MQAKKERKNKQTNKQEVALYICKLYSLIQPGCNDYYYYHQQKQGQESVRSHLLHYYYYYLPSTALVFRYPATITKREQEDMH